MREAADRFELSQQNECVPAMDKALLAKYRTGKSNRKVIDALTKYTVETAQTQFADWAGLEEVLLVKFIDGNVKAQKADGSFRHSQYYVGQPDGLEQPGYTDKWKEAVAKDHGSVIEVR